MQPRSNNMLADTQILFSSASPRYKQALKARASSSREKKQAHNLWEDVSRQDWDKRWATDDPSDSELIHKGVHEYVFVQETDFIMKRILSYIGLKWYCLNCQLIYKIIHKARHFCSCLSELE